LLQPARPDYAFVRLPNWTVALSWHLRAWRQLAQISSGGAREGSPKAACARPEELTAVIRAVERVSRLLSGAGCLVQARAARELLKRIGVEAEVWIAVRPRRSGPPTQFAHAWVEYQGRVVLGSGPGDYTVLGRIE
jgi:hypothetical protein